jgi:hypothetical protein
MQFKVTFEDIIYNCKNEIDAYNALLDHLRDCVEHEDIDAFKFELMPETEPKPKTTGYNPMNRSGNL